MTKLQTPGIPRYVDVRLFFTKDGKLDEIMITKEMPRRKAAAEENPSISPNTDVPFEEWNAPLDTVYAGQIPVGDAKVVIYLDRGSDYDDLVTEGPCDGCEEAFTEGNPGRKCHLKPKAYHVVHCWGEHLGECIEDF